METMATGKKQQLKKILRERHNQRPRAKEEENVKPQ